MALHHLLCHLATALCLLVLPIQAAITYVRGFHPVSPGTPDGHAIFVRGDVNGYRVQTLPFADGLDSSAMCGNIVRNSAGLGDHGGPIFTGPCATSTAKHDQVLNITCINPNAPQNPAHGQLAYVQAHFHSLNGYHTTTVTTSGPIWSGSVGDNDSVPLTTEYDYNVVQDLDQYDSEPDPNSKGVGLIINCYNDKRGKNIS